MRQQPFTIYDEFNPSHPFNDNDNDSDNDSDNDNAYEPRMSTSPSPYDADHGLSSDEADSVLPTIEAAPNARKSSAAFTSISSIPPSLPYDSDVSPYTPRKGARPAFRSPSSVRALQMSSPPPFRNSHDARMCSPMSARRARGGTPSSVRSGSVLHHIRNVQDYDQQSTTSQGQESGRGTPSLHHQPTQTRGPLVLLHVTVLPSPGLPYSTQSLQDLAPSYVLQNWYMLQEKLTETVLSRGVLIPHPGEEFDLLEESLLETLGLCAPRIGSCGHFHAQGHDSDIDSGNDSGVSGVGDDRKQLITLATKSHRWSTQSDMEDTCFDCARPIRLPGKGIGSGNTRWNINVYASNGLMSAGAWFAAYKEMERVDVEIEPWVPEDVRRALDMALEREENQARKEHEELDKLRFDLEVMQRLRSDADDERAKAEQRVADLEFDLDQAKKAVLSAPPSTPPATDAPLAIEDGLMLPTRGDSVKEPQSRTPPSSPPPLMPTPEPTEIPLSTLLRNYLILLVQDKRNIWLGVLSGLVILLSLRLSSPPHQATTTAPLTDTTRPQFGNSILSNAHTLTFEGRHSTVDTGSSTWSSLAAPVDDAVSTVLASLRGSVPIASASLSARLDAEHQPAESPHLRPERKGAVDVSHSSVQQQPPDEAPRSNAQQGAMPTAQASNLVD